MVNKVLTNAGWIVPGNDGNASQKRRIKGYVFLDAIFLPRKSGLMNSNCPTRSTCDFDGGTPKAQ
ncbi:hypothetical protein [Legionella fallonii]|uniref:hypothetical protein n=1 Tax=Legionella fallonii TaxID=96230 RepID=UPI0005D3E956|nr:hypothetical protein [Legionella fallonii]